jgi:hypothetical protein
LLAVTTANVAKSTLRASHHRRQEGEPRDEHGTRPVPRSWTMAWREWSSKAACVYVQASAVATVDAVSLTPAAHTRFAACSPSTTSATSAPSTTPHGQTAKQKPSSASCNANGPTPTSTPPAHTAPKPSPAGSAGTTRTDHTAASTANQHKAASRTMRCPTPSSRPVASLIGLARAGHRSALPRPPSVSEVSESALTALQRVLRLGSPVIVERQQAGPNQRVTGDTIAGRGIFSAS